MTARSGQALRALDRQLHGHGHLPIELCCLCPNIPSAASLESTRQFAGVPITARTVVKRRRAISAPIPLVSDSITIPIVSDISARGLAAQSRSKRHVFCGVSL